MYLEHAGHDVIHEFELANDVIDLRLLPEATAFADRTNADTANARRVRITYAALDGSAGIKRSSTSKRFASNFQMPDGQVCRSVIDGVWIGQPADQKEGSMQASSC